TGLSSTISGGFSTFAGTSMMEKYLDRITIILSVIFIFTTLYLVIYFK
ncbi:MAG: preprotein translocase subunit SecG, partial [Actinomycetia bacterium]|nr:preprotein translocase subunit SecG [Actinomycetes bacterium]